jgi:class 3 adenylate cyclase
VRRRLTSRDDSAAETDANRFARRMRQFGSMEIEQLDGSADLAAAREALAGHRWQEAFDLLTRADRDGQLSASALEALAQAAWFTAQPDVAVEARERVFKAHIANGNKSQAAAKAFELSREYDSRRKFSIASAWAARGEHLLEGEPQGFAHAYQALAQSLAAEHAGDLELAIKLAERAVELGARFSDADIRAWGLLRQGRLLIDGGRTNEGFPLMEEATVAAVNGELKPFVAGVAYCAMIATCRDAADYRRASEWTEATNRWCERQSIHGFPGICRIHRAEIVALHGALDQAEQELRQATTELAAYQATSPLSDGFYALGEIRFRLGDIKGAEDALRQAHAFGRSPQPALALLRLSEGNLSAAYGAIRSVLAETREQWARARMLPAQVEIAIAAGDPPTARTSAEELEAISARYDSPAVHGSKHDSWGRVLLAEGDAEGAKRELQSGIGYWREVGAPYELARDRAVLAGALRQLGRDDDADLELQAARDAFHRLGAVRDEAAAAEAIRVASPQPIVSVAYKTFMFTDIVASTSIASAIGDEAWEHLLRWHDDTLRAVFVEHGGEVVNSTGDGFFVAFDSATAAIRCATAVQRALAEQRRTHGFAPAVRIGVHSAVATRRGSDYSGKDVHVAARITALARGGEILASAATASLAETRPASEQRSVSLQGVGDVNVVSIAW